MTAIVEAPPPRKVLGILPALRMAAQAAWRAWCKARPIDVKFVTGVADPTVSRMDSGEGDPEKSIPQDESSLVLYRDSYGNYATESEIRLGLSRLQGTIVYAQECNDETAQDLVERMDAIELDDHLTPGEIALRYILKKNLLENQVK